MGALLIKPSVVGIHNIRRGLMVGHGTEDLKELVRFQSTEEIVCGHTISCSTVNHSIYRMVSSRQEKI